MNNNEQNTANKLTTMKTKVMQEINKNEQNIANNKQKLRKYCRTFYKNEKKYCKRFTNVIKILKFGKITKKKLQNLTRMIKMM